MNLCDWTMLLLFVWWINREVISYYLMLALCLSIWHWPWKLKWEKLLMFLMLLMLRSSSFKITCKLKLLSWSNLFCNFWKFMTNAKFTICLSLCLMLISNLCTLWKTMWNMGLYLSCFWVWCKRNNPLANEGLWNTKPYCPNMCIN